ncbi:MAG: exopolysaccharide biosynthesis polyprenyl glycosylphosphotransferase [Lentisphaeria bacterium]|nr:exopolysaccharide biosynthesis polyprenyl glycosylphosphotransferase [Lentisphaeria bacterium]
MSLFLKRFFDIVLSVLALIVLMPLSILVALLIKLDSRGPVFFVQDRVGRYGRHFRFYKFRSMYQGAELKKKELLSQNQSKDGVIFKMKKDPRITRVGRFIRKTSIDELPQFFNVLFGDMSLVGPRPPLPSEVQKYSLEDHKRLNIKPGLTCLWQIKGRSDIPFNEQVRLDKEYIQSQSLKHDLVILLKTIPAIISGRGAY